MDIERWTKIHRRYCNSKNKTWIEFKERVFERDGNKCVCCEGTDRLACHHKTYKHFMENNEDEMNDCVTLCMGCHNGVHRNGKAQKKFRNEQGDWMNDHQNIDELFQKPVKEPKPQKEKGKRSEAEKAFLRYYYWKKKHQ